MHIQATRLSLLAAVLLASSSALAGPTPKKSADAKVPTCPAGGNYKLQTKPSKEHPAPVKINGKTYYVCDHCARSLKAAGKKGHGNMKASAHVGKVPQSKTAVCPMAAKANPKARSAAKAPACTGKTPVTPKPATKK